MNDNSSLMVSAAAQQTMTQEQKEIVRRALAILYSTMQEKTISLTDSHVVRNYLSLQLLNKPSEVFVCLFLDNQHRLIEYRELFFGTIDCASVYPREVVREALQYNAAAVILAHNHPSGVAEPSRADRLITEQLLSALRLIDVRVLDHIVVGEQGTVSFTERGLL